MLASFSLMCLCLIISTHLFYSLLFFFPTISIKGSCYFIFSQKFISFFSYFTYQASYKIYISHIRAYKNLYFFFLSLRRSLKSGAGAAIGRDEIESLELSAECPQIALERQVTVEDNNCNVRASKFPLNFKSWEWHARNHGKLFQEMEKRTAWTRHRKKEMEYVGHTSMMSGVYGRQEQQGSKLKRSTGIKVF